MGYLPELLCTYFKRMGIFWFPFKCARIELLTGMFVRPNEFKKFVSHSNFFDENV